MISMFILILLDRFDRGRPSVADIGRQFAPVADSTGDYMSHDNLHG